MFKLSVICFKESLIKNKMTFQKILKLKSKFQFHQNYSPLPILSLRGNNFFILFFQREIGGRALSCCYHEKFMLVLGSPCEKTKKNNLDSSGFFCVIFSYIRVFCVISIHPVFLCNLKNPSTARERTIQYTVQYCTYSIVHTVQYCV